MSEESQEIQGQRAPEWTLIGEYPSLVVAEIDKALLDAAGIPVIVKGPESGIFGPGFSGPSPLGVRLYVPAELLEEARAEVPER